VKPLFILSLPRSGSTLLQRVLAADRQIESVAEPWLVLPFVYSLRERGIRAEYSHQLAHASLNDFLRELPNGRQDYLGVIGAAMTELYRKAAKNGGARYFLDKTPRYALIANELFDMFPDGKFIVLWRNPLAVVASMIETFWQGRWGVSTYSVDLYDGLANLISCSQSHSEKVLTIQYEHFVESPDLELPRIADYLEVKLDSDVLKNFRHVTFTGARGDPTGVKRYDTIDAAPLDKWKAALNNPLRKAWCRRYLRWLGEERLKVMGYDLNVLVRDLDSVRMSTRHVLMDCLKMTILDDRILNYIRMRHQPLLK
jgi:Sulfotransferase family